MKFKVSFKTDDKLSPGACTGQDNISNQMRSHNTDSSAQMAQSTTPETRALLVPPTLVNLIKSHKPKRTVLLDKKLQK